jgi:predicted nucleic acid-binding protein
VTRFVLDASVALAWFVDRTIAPYAVQVKRLLLEGDRAVVPARWFQEVANGFVVAERRGVLMPAQTLETLESFEVVLAQSIETSQEVAPVRLLIATAREYGLTAYDAAYLETARREHLPLATLDRQLLEAASKVGVEIVS